MCGLAQRLPGWWGGDHLTQFYSPLPDSVEVRTLPTSFSNSMSRARGWAIAAACRGVPSRLRLHVVLAT
jgi:hypothetical protein